MALRLGTRGANAAANAVCAELDGGVLRIFSGERPSAADVSPPVTARLLAELRFGRPAFGPASDGMARTMPMRPGLAIASGTATWCRALSAGGRAIWDGSVGTDGADLVITDTRIDRETEIQGQGLVYRQPLGETI